MSMDGTIIKIVFIAAAYLLGSIPFGYIISKASKGIDIRQHGSGGIGFTNVIRMAGTKEGVTVLLLDVIKGLGIVLLAKNIAGTGDWLGAVPLSAIMGHCYPVYLRFNAKGKGVATAFGTFLGLMPVPALIALAAWVVGVKYLRLVSVSSMMATTFAAMLGIIMDYPDSYVAFSLITTILIIFRHSENVQRLGEGKEHRWGEKREA